MTKEESGTKPAVVEEADRVQIRQTGFRSSSLGATVVVCIPF